MEEENVQCLRDFLKERNVPDTTIDRMENEKVCIFIPCSGARYHMQF